MTRPITIREAINYLLTQDKTLVVLCPGGFYSERLPYRSVLPLPAIVYTGISGGLDELMSGDYSGVVNGRIQFDIYGNQGDELVIEQIRDELIDGLNYNNSTVTTPNGSVTLLQLMADDIGHYLPDSDLAQDLRYSLDFMAQYGRL